MGRPLSHGRPAGRGRLHGRDGDPVQEPSISARVEATCLTRWGFQIVRQIRGKDETVVWSPVSRDIAGFLPQMGVLDGMTGLSTSRNLEIQPTFTASSLARSTKDLGQVVDGDPQPEGRCQLQVRRHVEPHRRLHAQP